MGVLLPHVVASLVEAAVDTRLPTETLRSVFSPSVWASLRYIRSHPAFVCNYLAPRGRFKIAHYAPQ